MSDRDKTASVIAFLRRTKNQAQIEQLAVDAFAAVQSGVVLTSVSFEGGSGTGLVEFSPSLLLQACEFLLAELAGTAPVSRVVFAQFSGSPIRT
jgi:hypothetical protein